ncbi:signal transduction histidine kinase (plasmid) [Mycobacterium sp. JS623]|uniref:sensor histidine kinase n=1 Tax=Mycobacterium sp. JS623 TaxID=212767 RepID=UPI0002A56A3A|nr:HAMP domain-containing sensor histidine kinase [Mycobacterium sp. JS623]AGB26803.1 signal transduction histidine kinase [Mycobacterium sp. JS623]
MRTDSDLSVVHRAGRIAASQASLALAAVLLVVGAVVYLVDIRVQEQQIRSQLSSVALAADDATDPPPGMILVLRDLSGKVQASGNGIPTAQLLARPAGFFETQIEGAPYRAVVVDRPGGRVVALLDLGPYRAGRSRLLLALGIAELAGIVASIGVVSLLTTRSIRPLVEALALQRRFVADASHELRAPLTVLHTRIQLLARRFEDGDAQQNREQIDALASDTRALGEVIEDLLASASMTSDNAPQERIDLASVVQAACESMAQHAETAGVNLVVEANDPVPAGDFVVLGSGSALRRAITSLIDNALAHEHRGGTIAVALGRHQNDILIDVRDDGVGIDPGAMETLFNRFSRGKTHTAPGDRPRYGIGLALVREIAHAHRGHIAVAQTPGGGATFTLTIPAAPVRPVP